jgi:uncharacterized RDD family membrane protein YckC
VERTLEVRTGEAVGIRYELAGLGSRFLALVLDMAIQLGMLLALAIPLVLAAASLNALRRVAGSTTVLAVLIAFVVLGLFVLFFGYFMLFELFDGGRTPGKRALGIRVVRDGGFPIDPGAAIVRNVVRIIEAGLGFYALSSVVVLLSPQSKRLGDYAAGTVVVRESAVPISSLDELLTATAPRDDGLDADDRVLIDRFLVRRPALVPQARAEIAARIAQRVRPKLAASFAHLDDEALLEHLARP